MGTEENRNRRRPAGKREADRSGRKRYAEPKKTAGKSRAKKADAPESGRAKHRANPSQDRTEAAKRRRAPAAPEQTDAAKQRSRESQTEQTVRRRRQTKRRKQQKKVAHWERRNRETQRRPVKPLVKRTVLLKLTAVLAVVAALALGLTIFFRVKNVQVSGNQKYTAQEIIDASGIDKGENLLTLGKFKIAAGIKEELHYVAQVQVGIKLPDTVNIDIVERSASFAIEGADGAWWLLDGDGMLLEQTENAQDYICLTGVRVDAPAAGQMFTQVLQQTDGETSSGAESGDGSAADKAAAALEIMAALSKTDRDGEITVIDVSELYDLKVQYGSAYQVLLSGPTDLSYKVQYMSEAIESLVAQGYRGGVLDLSFREEGEAVFTPQS